MRARLERTALDLALEHGFDNVTVEMICDACMISPRTFFNYFGSKDSVILGPPLPMPTAAAIRDFVTSQKKNVLAEFIALATGALVDPNWDTELTRARMTVIAKNPELTIKRSAMIAVLEDQYEEVLVARFMAQGRDPEDPALKDEARMVMGLASAVTTFTRRKWVDPGFTGDPKELLAYAIELAGTYAHHERPGS